jgi:glycosyltransferase involved in cell wall biosynthesis
VPAPDNLRILYVVHGFPPDTWAGTEVYTLHLARAMQRLGHDVLVLARTDARAGEREFELREDSFQGLRVLRMPRDVVDQSLRESYRHSQAERVFRDVLAREKPDLVHFQHLLHFSAALPRIAREAHLPSVVTLNDYWPLCARVQFIRPDGVRCDENQGLGCLVCVKDKNPRRIALARRLFPLVRPAVALARMFDRAPLERWEQRVGRPSRLVRMLRDYDAARERNDFVLDGIAAADLCIAPSRFLLKKMLDTGRFDPRRFVYSDYGIGASDALVRSGVASDEAATDAVASDAASRGDVPTSVAGPAKRVDADGNVRFGFIGSLVGYKGVDVLVRAMGELTGARCVLHVHGDFKPDTDAYHAELARLARGARVVFHGRFANERIGEIYRDTDVLVVPSIWFENSPITIHEAFVHATPVVTSNIGGMAELVRDGVDGLHFEVGSSAHLARVLRRFVDDPQLVARLSKQFPRVMSIDEDAREMESRYRALCRERR